MHTFLPFASYTESAKCLDRQKLHFGVKDSLTLVRSLVRFYPLNKRGESGFEMHTVGRFWSGHELQLARYSLALAEESLRRVNRKRRITADELTQRKYYVSMRRSMVEALEDRNFPDSQPALIGQEDFHSAMRAYLLYRDIQNTTFKLCKRGFYPKHITTSNLLPRKASWKREHFEAIWEYFDRPESESYAQFNWTEEPDDLRLFYSDDRIPQMQKERQRKIDRPMPSFFMRHSTQGESTRLLTENEAGSIPAA